MGNICDDLKLIKNKIAFEVWFDLKVPNCKGMLLTSDKDVGTCLYLMKNDPAYKKSLFVVDIVKDGGKADLVAETSNTLSLLTDVIEQNNDDSTISMDFQVPMMENETSLTAMEVVPLPITVVQHKNPKRRENEEEDDDLIILGDDASVEDIKLNSIFENKQKLKKCFSKWAIDNHFEFHIAKSCTKRLCLRCKDKKCNWTMNAFRVSGTLLLKIVKYNEVHTCSVDVRTSDQKHATSKMISELFKDRLYDPKADLKPLDIMNEMRRVYGVTVDYKKAYRSLQKAQASVRGTPEDNYMLLPSYLYMMKQNNPGTHTNIKLGEDNMFKYTFFAYGASISGWNHCRPVIVVDATFLTSRYGGILMIAVAKDGNNNNFPIAFGIGDSENTLCWQWFFEQLKEVIGDRDNLAILSDRHPSIAAAVKKVYPNCLHGICVYHLEQNLIGKFKNTTAIGLFKKAIKAYQREEFHYFMSEIRKLDNRIEEYLMEEPPERWARSYAPRRRYDMLTSNIVESMNALFRDVKDRPILCLMDEIQRKLQEWFYKRRNDARAMFHSITTWAEKKLLKKITAGFKMLVEPVDSFLFKVTDLDNQNMVNLEQKTCTCLEFDLDEIPCTHAIAAIEKLHLLKSTYCSEWFDKEHLIQAYGGHIVPVGDKTTWTVPEDIEQKVTNPPFAQLKSGRRKKHRFKSTSDHIRDSMYCSRCKRKGHVKSQCTVSPKFQPASKRQKAN